MGYFDEPENVQTYIEMAEGYDGRNLINILTRHLPAGSTVLELGMGPGKDFDILSQTYAATGSDASNVFVEMGRGARPSADILQLDAVTLETRRSFNCIYSNKVLHHLERSDLRRSFARQWEVLADQGLLLHSFWHGHKEEELQGMRFVYYEEDELLETIGTGFQVVETARYQEFEEQDSFYLLLRKSPDR